MAKQFESRLYKEVGDALGYRISNTGGYNAKGNSQVERMHRDLGAILRALLEDQPDSWEDVLPQALFALRTNCLSIDRPSSIPDTVWQRRVTTFGPHLW